MNDISGTTTAGLRRWAGLATLSLATLTITFDMFVLLLTVPGLTADLGPTGVQQLWILDVYGFMVGGFLVIMGTLGDRIGRRRLLVIGGSCFALASALCAYSTSPEMLIGGRALLGVAGATLAPSTLALITNMFRDARQRGLAIGVWAGSFTLGAILGPVIGGLMLERFWWGSVFLLAVPVMAVMVLLAPVLVPEFKDPGAGRIDLLSAGQSLIAIIGVVYAIKEVARHGPEPLPLLVGAGGLLVGWAFARRQLRLTDPLLDLRMFRSRQLSTTLVGLVLYGLVGASSLMFITQYLQSVAGLSPLRAALCLLPGMATATVSAILSPLVARRVRPAYLIGFGLLGVVAALAWLTRLEPTSGPFLIVAVFAVIGLCDGPLISLGTDLVLRAVPLEKAGAASSLSQTANEGGAALGVAVMGSLAGAVYQNRIGDTLPPGLPADAAEAARENISSAVTAASGLAGDLGDALAAVAADAFTDGMVAFAATAAVLVTTAATIILVLLRHIPPTTSTEDAATSETHDRVRG